MQTITPCLWFDHQAEEAVQFYTSIFKNSKVGRILRYDQASSAAAEMPKGSVLTIDFELNGQEFIALNGGPIFKFTEAVSFFIKCANQEEVDYFWEKLTDGGEPSHCGWLKDKFGVSWQVVPVALPDMLHDPDPVKSQRVMKAMLQMARLDLAVLQKAYDGK
jgi:predicted 3-demethylubiquinone-9 3-methyltransferase (glyoxalase superfamily)